MLKHLTIKDFAVVSAAELTFEGGLSVVSGETGAGKSLLVDALLCLTGARADAGMVRHGAQRAELSAEFDLADAVEAAAWLRENELDSDSACHLRRVIRADGGSRGWINGSPATLAQMGAVGALLVEIHGQHEHQALLDRAHQLGLLDAFGQHPGPLADVARLDRQWQEVDRQLQELARSGDVGERIEFLQHQVDELGRETLDPADLDEMLAAHKRQSNAAGLLAAYDAVLSSLSGDEGLSVGKSLHQLEMELSRHLSDEPRLQEVTSLFESAQIQVDEAVSLLERLRDDLDLDPQRLEQIEARLTRLHELGRKHRVQLQELSLRRDALSGELERLRGAGELGVGLLERRGELAAEWRQSAQRLSQARAKAASTLGRSVSALMAELGMPGGVLEVELQAIEGGTPHPAGAERCELLVSANPGQPPRPLRKVASGGELARISLAIEVAALGLDSVPTMIFDEVDSGIGGAVAEVVGQKLRALGAQRQVLCVTHLPQVAAQGHHHFQVSKSVSNSHTESAVRRLDEKARVEELARMLGGVEITRETRANARQMLSSAQA